jgi:hypothetical protein
MQFENDGEDVHQEIQDFLKNFDRTLATPAQIDSIDSSVSNPINHLDANYQAISAATDIPKSILSGKDRADTANATDLTKYERTIASRRNNHATPNIVKPFIQRMIEVGILPEPEGDGFVVEWPPLEELSELQEWELKGNIATAVKAISPGGDTSMLATVPELRQAIGWEPNVGGNIDEDVLEEPQEDQMPDRPALGQASGEDVSGVDAESDGQLEVDESELPTSTVDEFPFPDELYERPVDAEERAGELDLGQGYRVHLIDGEVRYVPGESLEVLAEALDGQSQQVENNRPTRTRFR